MCYVQIAGMLVATLVTLVIVPVLYVIFVEDLRLVRWETEPKAEHEDARGSQSQNNANSSGIARTDGTPVAGVMS
jgi:hypothetical protein